MQDIALVPNQTTTSKSSFGTQFSRSQISSFASTVVDYGFLFICTEVLHIWYVVATAGGAALGAVTNFMINRHWSFEASEGKMSVQAKRYCLVSLLSLVLNTGGVYLMTEFGQFHYAISVGVVSLFIGFAVNYPLHRHYVYRLDH